MNREAVTKQGPSDRERKDDAPATFFLSPGSFHHEGFVLFCQVWKPPAWTMFASRGLEDG